MLKYRRPVGWQRKKKQNTDWGGIWKILPAFILHAAWNLAWGLILWDSSKNGNCLNQCCGLTMDVTYRNYIAISKEQSACFLGVKNRLPQQFKPFWSFCLQNSIYKNLWYFFRQMDPYPPKNLLSSHHHILSICATGNHRGVMSTSSVYHFQIPLWIRKFAIFFNSSTNFIVVI